MSSLPKSPTEASEDRAPKLGVGTGSVIRFRKRVDTDDLCSAEYRGHMIDCTADWRRPGVWHVFVRDKTGELVAEMGHEGHNRREMLEAAVLHAGIDIQNAEVSHE